MDLVYNNETARGANLPPFLINNSIFRGDKAMTEKSIPLFKPESQDVPLCACGCGAPVTKNKRYPKRWNTFIFGHGLRKYHPDSGPAPLCACGCGGVIERRNSYGKWNTFLFNHQGIGKSPSKETRRKLSKAGKGRIISKEQRVKISKAKKGCSVSNATRIKISVTLMENMRKSGGYRKSGYCDIWGDTEYISDIRKPACERCGITNMMSIHLFGKQLSSHHLNGKKECAPSDIQSLCNRCHPIIHAELRRKVMEQA